MDILLSLTILFVCMIAFLMVLLYTLGYLCEYKVELAHDLGKVGDVLKEPYMWGVTRQVHKRAEEIAKRE